MRCALNRRTGAKERESEFSSTGKTRGPAGGDSPRTRKPFHDSSKHSADFLRLVLAFPSRIGRFRAVTYNRVVNIYLCIIVTQKPHSHTSRNEYRMYNVYLLRRASSMTSRERCRNLCISAAHDMSRLG